MRISAIRKAIMKKFKLVLCDNDGTLVDDERVLTPRTKRAIERLHEEGYLFGIASGRTYEDLSAYPGNWGLYFDFDVYVCLNGAQLYDGIDGKLYNSNFLQPDKIKEIMDVTGQLDFIATQIIVNDRYYFDKVDDRVRASIARNNRHKITIMSDISKFYENPVPKIIIRVPEERMPEMEAFAAAHPIEGVESFKTQNVCYEYMVAGTNKTVAMKQFCQLHDIALDEVISFGDTTNDNEMLRDSYGVCMINGTDDTKAVAREITEYSNNEDGWARYVEKHLLGE